MIRSADVRDQIGDVGPAFLGHLLHPHQHANDVVGVLGEVRASGGDREDDTLPFGSQSQIFPLVVLGLQR